MKKLLLLILLIILNGCFKLPENIELEKLSSDSRYNTFTAEEYRSHVVLLKDEVSELLLLGFEEISSPGGDNDFNDAVFYRTASPFSAIQKSNLVSTKTNPAIDSDNNGVSDINDSYPDDPAKAFNIAIPGENIYGSLAFEDMWPRKGDYDLNDMVIDYNFNLLTNSSNEIVEMIANIKLKAMGAGFKNGFDFEMDLPPSAIETVTGSVLYENIIALLPNGLESGQEKSVSKAYLKFNSWAENAGYEYREWYEDLSGYRDYLNIF